MSENFVCTSIRTNEDTKSNIKLLDILLLIRDLCESTRSLTNHKFLVHFRHSHFGPDGVNNFDGSVSLQKRYNSKLNNGICTRNIIMIGCIISILTLLLTTTAATDIRPK